MAKVEVVVEQAPEEAEDAQLQEAARTLFLASMGAVAVVQDMLEYCMAKAVERGADVERETRDLLRGRMEKRRHQIRKVAGKREQVVADAEAELETQVSSFLERMNVPSKDDINALGAQVAELTKKVDELKTA
jgi:poly(hydroxyalkanoate) granule-associated protein